MPASSSPPLVVATTVIRTAHRDESLGGVFLVDLASAEVADWRQRRQATSAGPSHAAEALALAQGGS